MQSVTQPQKYKKVSVVIHFNSDILISYGHDCTLFTLLFIFVCLYCMPILSTLRLTKFLLQNFTTTTTTNQ